MKEAIFSRYPILETLPELAGYKTLFLNLGVDCDSDLQERLSYLSEMKTKHRIKKHRVRDGKLIDVSKDTSIIPSEVILERDGERTLSKVSYRPDSPLKLEVYDGGLHLVDTETDEELEVGIQPVPRRSYSDLRIPSGRRAREGTKLSDYVQILGMDRIGVLAYSGCQHWLEGKMCRFCDENPKRSGELGGMPSLNTLRDFDNDVEEWWMYHGPAYIDGIAYAFQELLETEDISPHIHLQLMAGNLQDVEEEWEICTEIATTLNSVRDLSTIDSYLNIVPPRESRTPYLQRGKYLGFRNIAFNLEVFGEEKFEEVCPGKAELFGYQNMVDALKESVRYFGHGKVRSNFVLGAQPVHELLRGIRELAKDGIVSDYSIFVPKRGTPWANKEAPSMETVVRFTNELVNVYREHGFKGIYCGLSSRSNVLHEVLEGY